MIDADITPLLPPHYRCRHYFHLPPILPLSTQRARGATQRDAIAYFADIISIFA
jgi:hypothetical protein